MNIPVVVCSRRSDHGDSAKRCEQKTKQQGGGVGVRVPPISLSLFSSLFFSRSLPSCRTPLSKHLEQAIPVAVNFLHVWANLIFNQVKSPWLGRAK